MKRIFMVRARPAAPKSLAAVQLGTERMEKQLAEPDFHAYDTAQPAIAEKILVSMEG